MRHGVTLLLQFFLFSFCQFALTELIELELQEVHVLPVALYLFAQGLQGFLLLLVLRESFLIGSHFLGVLSQDVDYVQLEVLLVEQQVLVLRVNIH